MITHQPGLCLQTISRLHRTTQNGRITTTLTTTNLALARSYSFTKTAKKRAPTLPRFSNTATATSSSTPLSKVEAVNPPATTLPPPLDLPVKDGSVAYPIHLYRTGRAYGTFYKNGLKNVWANHKAALALKKRVVAALNKRQPDLASPISEGKRWSALRDDAVRAGVLSRAEFQLLERNRRDIGKLPFFGLLVLLLGEWLPLLVPFIPNRVPGTCRIPKQVTGMREKTEERRRRSFRSGVEEPAAGQVAVEGGQWRMMEKGSVREVLKALDASQLLHLSRVLNQHSGVWEKVGLEPLSPLVRAGVLGRVQYLAQDDFLLVRGGGPDALSKEEVTIACEERGIDVLGVPEGKLRDVLEGWVKKQKDDEGRGWAVVEMLFKRPNAWTGAALK